MNLYTAILSIPVGLLDLLEDDTNILVNCIPFDKNDERWLVDLVIKDYDTLVTFLAENEGIEVVGVWKKDGLQLGISYDDGNIIGTPTYTISTNEILNIVNCNFDDDGNVLSYDNKIKRNFSGWNRRLID